MNSSVDTYLNEGCGRCPMHRTPQCKVHAWKEELMELRRIVLECGLEEEVKWSQPCYTFQGKNILIVTAFKAFASISFFKGALLRDNHQILQKPGDNSQAVRYLRFSDVERIQELEIVVKSYVMEAIELQKTEAKVPLKKEPEPIPMELAMKFDEAPAFKVAFEKLTKGRQRGYILHFSQPKQSKTRKARIEKCVSKILEGKGLHDDYKRMKRFSK